MFIFYFYLQNLFYVAENFGLKIHQGRDCRFFVLSKIRIASSTVSAFEILYHNWSFIFPSSGEWCSYCGGFDYISDIFATTLSTWTVITIL